MSTCGQRWGFRSSVCSVFISSFAQSEYTTYPTRGRPTDLWKCNSDCDKAVPQISVTVATISPHYRALFSRCPSTKASPRILKTTPQEKMSKMTKMTRTV